MGSFHHTARKRLFEICQPGSNWRPIVDFLRVSGDSLSAGYFTAVWKQRNVRLADEDLRALAEANNLWVRLAVLKLLEKQSDVKMCIDALETTLQNLRSALDREKAERGLEKKGEK
jgi:hypothetical protein